MKQQRSSARNKIQNRLHIAIMAETAAMPDADSETVDGELSRIKARADATERGCPGMRSHTWSWLLAIVTAGGVGTVALGGVAMAFLGGVAHKIGVNLLILLAAPAASGLISMWRALSYMRMRRPADTGEIVRSLTRSMIMLGQHRDDDGSS